MTTDTEDAERLQAQLAQLGAIRLGQIVGVAAVVAALPGTAELSEARVRGLIDALLVRSLGAGLEAQYHARAIASELLAAAKLWHDRAGRISY